MNKFDVIVIGAGTAGLSAYRKLVAKGLSVGLVEPNDITTTCARVGCMPSKLLIAAAESAHNVSIAGKFGIDVHGWELNDKVLWDRIRSERDRFVGFVSRGAESIPVIKGYATFVDKNTIEIFNNDALVGIYHANAFVLATGSTPFVPPVFETVKPYIHTNETIFEITKTPKRLAVFGAGVIGLELGLAFKNLGTTVHLFNMGSKFLGLNPEISDYLKDYLADNVELHLNTSVSKVARKPNMFSETGFVFELEYAGETIIVDEILVATGRRPNLQLLDKVYPEVSLKDYNRSTTQLGATNLFLAGDVNNDSPLLHEASKEGEIAANAVCQYLQRKDILDVERLVPLMVVFASPQIMSVGNCIIDDNTVVGEVSFEDQGRSRVMLKNVGIAQLYFDKRSSRLKGAQMIGPDAEHIAHLLSWAIANNNTVEQLLSMPFYHPVVEEGIRTAIRDAASKLV